MRSSISLLAGVSLLALTQPALADDGELLILDWSGFEEDPYWEAYAAKHGDMPTYSFFGDEEEAFQKLRSGFRADVAHPCPQSVQKWIEADLIEPWDVSKIPSYMQVAEVFRTDPTFVQDGKVYFIPGDMGATAIAYNTDELTPEDVSTLQVFTNPALAGRISLPDVVDDAYALAFLATGTSDWTTATEENFQKASAWLREVHPLVRTYWTDGAELAQLMGTGEVLLSWAWNETPVQLADEGQPIAFEREPQEGSSMWFCGYVNIKDGPGDEAKAHDFMESFLQPSVAEYIVTEWGYGHGNAAAMEAIDAETLEEVGLNPIDGPVLNQVPMDIRLREQMIKEFERIKAGF
ncbi:extracellular solute-binding protein [Fluviibacterium sp. DFM31]|uniref:Extracellular solute-binding protein n=1 Tax=Meridianimarinicoccus marinus TaxID=3231483 RepID=A0ABV3L4Z6_9RHOB